MPSTINADNGAISGSAGVKTTADSSGVLDLQTNGTTRLTIDTSGNMGLAVTPGTWGSTLRALQIGRDGAVSAGTTFSEAYFSGNARYDGSNWKYISTNPAAYYSVGETYHKWFIAGSGTAGNTITFTQAMTLDASGNLGVGTTSPGNFSGVSLGDSILDVNGVIQVRGDATNGIAAFQLGGGTYRKAIILSPVGTDTPYLAFGVADSGSSSSATERARITSGGLFLLNTTTTLRYADAILQSKVVDGWAGTFQHEGTSAQNGALSCVVENTNGRLIRFQYQATEVGAITTNGTNTTYGTGSDVRLKKDIVPAPDAGADVDAINIVSFKWKSNGSETKYGVVAQELVNVSPEAVQKGDDSEDVVAAWGVDYSKLVPMLVKEIQSLRVRSAALEAEVAALKAR